MADAHGRVAKTAHEVTVAAPPDLVYRLLADLANWPWIFRPFVHAERLGADGPFDRVGMWTTTGDQVEHWVALRRLDEARLRIDFRPEEPAAPLATMERSWIVEPRSGGSCTVRLLHRCSVLGDDPSALESTARVIDTIADAETQAVKRAAELVAGTPELKVEVTDTVGIAGSEKAVHHALHDVRSWPGILPHVARAEVVQDTDGRQLVEIETVERSGKPLAMRTARVSLAPYAVVYKQLALPPISSSHHVRWHIEPTAGGVEVTSHQTVIVEPPGIERMLGSGKGTADATEFIQRELSAKVRLVLDGVKKHIEAG